MFAGKVAVLLLACWTLVSHQPVLGMQCTYEQKREILRECDPLKSTPVYTPSRDSACCVAVRKVPGTRMLCIIAILTPAEELKYSEIKIVGLRDACDPPHSPHHQVNNNINSFYRSLA